MDKNNSQTTPDPAQAQNTAPKGKAEQNGKKSNDAQKSQQISAILQQDRKHALWQAFSLCRGDDEIRAFITDLCTPQEIHALSERWVIARLLDEGGMSYRDISADTGASTTTVGRVARFLQQEPHLGYRRILDRLARTARAGVTGDDTGTKQKTARTK